MDREIETQARLIESLAATINNRMWSDDILIRCRQIKEAVDVIETKARSRLPSEG